MITQIKEFLLVCLFLAFSAPSMLRDVNLRQERNSSPHEKSCFFHLERRHLFEFSAVQMFFIVVSQCHINSSSKKMELSRYTTIPHEHISKQYIYIQVRMDINQSLPNNISRNNISHISEFSTLTLPMLRLLSFKAQGRKDFGNHLTLPCWYSLESSRWVLSDEYPCARVQSFFSVSFLHHFVLAKLASSSMSMRGAIFMWPWCDVTCLRPRGSCSLGMFP